MTDENGQIEADDNQVTRAAAGWPEDLRDCLMFLTRLPMPQRAEGQHRRLARAVRGFPVAGALIGAIGGLALLAAQGAGLPVLVVSAIAISAVVLVTGALHEDGLADVADGFGAGGTRERKLEIMRDSAIGTYGVLALVIVVLVKAACLAALIGAAQSVWHAPVMLVATAALSRTFVVVAMEAMPAARSDGRALEAGQPSRHAVNQTLLAGLTIGVVLLWLICSLWTVFATVLAGAIAYYIVKRRAMYHIGGQTGDVLGTVQQLTETAMLMALSATYC